MTALIRFQVASYVRSLRILHPLIVVAMVVVLVLYQGPAGPHASDLAVGTFGDVAAFMFPIWAWAARALLDTQPDEQRALTTLAARRPSAPTWAGLLAAYGVNLALGTVALVIPIFQAIQVNAPTSAILTGCALSLLVAIPGTLIGAWTTRALIPDPGVSLIALLGALTAAILLGLGRLSWLAVPLIEWIRTTHDGANEFTSHFPAIALHLALWSALAGTAYITTTRHRP